MKNLVFLFLLLFTASTTFAQNGNESNLAGDGANQSNIEVPQKVLDSHAARYSDAGNTKWKLNKHGEYRAKFEIDDRRYMAKYAPLGTWLYEEFDLSESERSLTVFGYVDQNYHDQKITMFRMWENQKGHKGYKVKIEKKNGDETTLTFDLEGKFLRPKK